MSLWEASTLTQNCQPTNFEARVGKIVKMVTVWSSFPPGVTRRGSALPRGNSGVTLWKFRGYAVETSALPQEASPVWKRFIRQKLSPEIGCG